MLPTEKLLELQQCRSFAVSISDSLARVSRLQELMEIAANEHGHHCSYMLNPLGFDSTSECLKSHDRVDLMFSLYLQSSKHELQALNSQMDELRELLVQLARQ
ncbi:MAG: hypothetical protein F6K24_22830 [Okeania sp. SIO2D1]|nr:hypothetical protein [Okeania sp. SIO2D1]